MVLPFFALLVSAVLLTACADSTAVLNDVRLCSEPGSGPCPTDESSFSRSTPKIRVTGSVTEVPRPGALVTVRWLYLEGGEPEEIQSLTLPATEENAPFDFYIEETEQWRPGAYEVVLSTGEAGSESTPVSREFRIT